MDATSPAHLSDLAFLNVTGRVARTLWIKEAQIGFDLFSGRQRKSPHLSTRQYARLVDTWVSEIGLDPSAYGTHSLRRTKPTLDLPAHEESPSCAVSARPYEA